MLLIYLIANYLYRKYGVPLNNFLENWTRGISHFKAYLDLENFQMQEGIKKSILFSTSFILLRSLFFQYFFHASEKYTF